MAEALPNSIQISAAIRKIRKERTRLKVEGLAHAAGVSTSYMSNIENLGRNPSWDVVAAIVKALGIELSELITEAQTMPPEPPSASDDPKA